MRAGGVAWPEVDTIDGIPLDRLREWYRYDLFDDFLPFLEKHVVDQEIGGFLCTADRDGTLLSTDKDSWYDGRGIWVYSFLYRHFTHDARHLEIARKTAGFLLKHRPNGAHPLWPRRYSRTGEPIQPDGEIYGTLFIAEGLAELSAAADEPRYGEVAKELMLACIDFYDRPDYSPNTRHYLGTGAPEFPGARVLGAPMVLLRLATNMLRFRADADVERIAERAVDALTVKHHNPAYDLTNEFLNFDYSLSSNEYAQLVYTGHALEAMWMVMDEAVRRGDERLFGLAAARFRRHVEVSWDGVYGGCFPGLRHVDRNDWFLDKYLWVQEEVLVGCLLLFERRRDPWAGQMFGRMYRYARDKFPMARHGFPLWINAADRKVTFEPHYNRIENYHHPRHLMLNLLAIERLACS